jgi:OOP family OmpA-OmpF porin
MAILLPVFYALVLEYAQALSAQEQNMKPVASTIRFRMSALASLIALVSPLALAQEKVDTGWYLGAGLGKSWVDVDVGSVVARLHTAGYDSSTVSTYDNDTNSKLFAGYKFDENIALEASYIDLGKFNYVANVVPTATQQGNAKITGLSLDLIGMLPLQDKVFAYARLGVTSSRMAQTYSNGSMGAGFANISERGTHENYGVGLQMEVGDALSVRAELQRFPVNHNSVTDNSVNTLSVGVVYRFGASSKPAVAEVVKPAPAVAAAPATTPVPVPPPAPPPAPVKITLAATALFDFDKSELKAAGKQELDKLANDLKGVRFEVIIVTGHTDRIGKHSYNLPLSERRASAVRSYLVSAGIPGGNNTAKGVNSDQPVTTQIQCQGPVSAALKACLQPDRRVEVEVSGTRAP